MCIVPDSSDRSSSSLSPSSLQYSPSPRSAPASPGAAACPAGPHADPSPSFPPAPPPTTAPSLPKAKEESRGLVRSVTFIPGGNETRTPPVDRAALREIVVMPSKLPWPGVPGGGTGVSISDTCLTCARRCPISLRRSEMICWYSAMCAVTLVVLRTTLVWMFFARCAYLRVEVVSSNASADGARQQSITVLELPPRLSFSSRVSFESL
mmetsp:Transcript_42692/g.100203  ORF Transcript_42692/g.100203 Transcript_42692/m.100203 type:complete len:209 (+) Transcript_42692:909-1535(+)